MVEAAGNFGARPKPPKVGSKLCRSRAPRPSRIVSVSGSVEGAGGRAPPQRLVDPLRLLLDVRSPLAPRVGDRAEQVAERRHPCRGSGGK